jgi:hypothetical protein
MHALLTRDARPRVHEIPDHLNRVLERRTSGVGPDKSRGKRWVPSLAPLIPERQRGAMLQHRQFVVASRREVALYPSTEEVVRLFGEMGRAEERMRTCRPHTYTYT